MQRRWVGALLSGVMVAACGDDDPGATGSSTSSSGTGGGGGEPAGVCVPAVSSKLWEAKLTGGDFTGGYAYISAVGVLPGGDAAVAISYITQSSRPGVMFAGTSLPIVGSRDGTSGVFVVRLRADGTVAWMKQVEGTTTGNVLERLAVDGQGNIFIAGRFYSDMLDVSGTVVEGRTSSGAHAAVIAKLDADGDVVWAASFGENEDDVTDIAALGLSSSGDAVLSLGYASQFHFGTAMYAGLGSAVLAGVDGTGAPAWSHELPSADNVAVALTPRPEGGVRAIGEANESFTIGSASISGDGVYELDLSVDGVPNGTRSLAPMLYEPDDEPAAVGATAHYLLTGSYYDGESLSSATIARRDGSGFAWTKSMRHRATAVTEDPQGRVLLLEFANQGTCDVLSGPVLVSRRDQDGGEEVRLFIENETVYPRLLASTPNGEVLVAGDNAVWRFAPLPEAP